MVVEDTLVTALLWLKLIPRLLTSLGHVQGTIIMEIVFDHIATFLGKENPDDVKELNLYQDGQVEY